MSHTSWKLGNLDYIPSIFFTPKNDLFIPMNLKLFSIAFKIILPFHQGHGKPNVGGVCHHMILNRRVKIP